MKKIISLAVFFILLGGVALAQKKEASLLGICSAKALEAEPYGSWYNSGFKEYEPQPQVIEQIKKLDPAKFTMRIFFGSWCGDSKRELPRMMKVLKAAGFSEKNIQLIGVSDSLPTYKQSPKREEKGLNIYRVPTFIVYQKEKEVGRIIEFAVESLERDLHKILAGQPYTPNYKSLQQIGTWHTQGVLADANVNPRGLADQIRSAVIREGELNSAGYILLGRGDVNEAITVFRVNVNLYPESSNCFDSLGEAYLAAGLKEKSKACYEYAVELNPKNENAVSQLAKLK